VAVKPSRAFGSLDLGVAAFRRNIYVYIYVCIWRLLFTVVVLTLKPLALIVMVSEEIEGNPGYC